MTAYIIRRVMMLFVTLFGVMTILFVLRTQIGDPTLFLTLLYQGTWYHVPGRAVRNII